MESSLPVIEYYNSKGKVRKVIPQLWTLESLFSFMKSLTCWFLAQIDAGKPIEEVFEDVKEIFSPYSAQVRYFYKHFFVNKLGKAQKRKKTNKHMFFLSLSFYVLGKSLSQFKSEYNYEISSAVAWLQNWRLSCHMVLLFNLFTITSIILKFLNHSSK